MSCYKINGKRCEKVIDSLRALPKPGSKEYDDAIEFMRADLACDMQYSKIEMMAQKIVKEDGRDFDEEFGKWKKEHEVAEINGCSGYKSPTECPHNGVFDQLSPACKECVEDATIGYDTSDIL